MKNLSFFKNLLLLSVVAFTFSCEDSLFTESRNEVSTGQPEINSESVVFRGTVENSSNVRYEYGFLLFGEDGTPEVISLGTTRGNVAFTTAVADLAIGTQYIVCAFAQVQRDGGGTDRTVGEDIPFVLP